MKIHFNVEFKLMGKNDEADIVLNHTNAIKNDVDELKRSLKPATEIPPETLSGNRPTTVEELLKYNDFIQDCVAPATLKLIARAIAKNDAVLNPKNRSFKDKCRKGTIGNSELSTFMAEDSQSKYELRGSDRRSLCEPTPDGHRIVTNLYLSHTSRLHYWPATSKKHLEYSVVCEISVSRGA